MKRELPRYALNLCSALRRMRVRQSDLAYSIGVSRTAVSLWARGMRKPSEDHAKAIARELDIQAERLMGGKPHRESVYSVDQGRRRL